MILPLWWQCALFLQISETVKDKVAKLQKLYMFQYLYDKNRIYSCAV